MVVDLMVQRFYENLLCDEGYIMLTLPVSVHQHIFSKLIASSKVLRVLSCQLEYLKLLQTADLMLLAVEQFSLFLLCGAVTCLQFYAALATGHSFCRKKILLSAVFYFVLQMTMQTLLSLCALSPIALLLTRLTEDIHLDLNRRAWMDYVHVIDGFTALITAIQGAVYYLFTAFILKQRLNLE